MFAIKNNRKVLRIVLVCLLFKVGCGLRLSETLGLTMYFTCFLRRYAIIQELKAGLANISCENSTDLRKLDHNSLIFIILIFI